MKMIIFLRYFSILTSWEFFDIVQPFSDILHMGQFSDIFSEILQIKIKVGGPFVLCAFSKIEGLLKLMSIQYGNPTRIG